MNFIFKGLLPTSKQILYIKNIKWVRNEHGRLEGATHKPSDLEKKFLVWTGKYKTVAEVPDHVSQSAMERARNRMRIRIANYMMGATAFGCLVMVYLGKEDLKRGDSVVKRNLAWHKNINEESKKEN